MGAAWSQWSGEDHADANDCRYFESTSGKILYDGRDIHSMGEEYRDLFGFLLRILDFFQDFTVNNYLEYVAALKDVPVRETRKKN